MSASRPQPDVVVARIRVADVRFHPHNVRRDLGDLRDLTGSIKRYGVMQPLVVERYGPGFRLRAGHRRLAAARLAGLASVPALVHREVLEDDEFLMQALHENLMRRGLDHDERRQALHDLRDAGCTWQGIADSLSVSVATVKKWAAHVPTTGKRPGGTRLPTGQLRDLIDSWRERASHGLSADDAAALIEQLDALAHRAKASTPTVEEPPAPQQTSQTPAERTPQPCGTNAAFVRHTRRGEEPCPACRAARMTYRQQLRLAGAA
ncbi:ParB/RepB/Spo0J family partition protein [Kineococcus terrestris]|uniref:ParB/RepB/Spo0J family partition protein n=1 Tax=Kineococcus terrestris TaxID=2044856 RepID=UPI0034DB2449